MSQDASRASARPCTPSPPGPALKRGGWGFALLASALLALGVAAPASRAAAANVPVRIDGVNTPLADNIRLHLQAASVLAPRLETARQRSRYLERARDKAALALRPWGYYRPTIEAALEPAPDSGGWSLVLQVKPGPPVRIHQTTISINGPGANEPAVQEWREEWPLKSGKVLHQSDWEAQKQAVMAILAERGYFQAEFTQHRIALDLEQNTANLELEIDTGPRALMGTVDYEQTVVQPYVLRPIARFDPGDPYQAASVEQLRLDLWRSGYFRDIEVIEQKRLQQEPPVVDLQVRAERRNRTTHQGAIGYGTDTQFRTQYNWTHHLLSDRGDTLGIGVGWRQRDSEVRVSGDYRLPRDRRKQQYWVVNSLLRQETEDLVIQDGDGEEIARLASGQVTDLQVKLGRLKLRNNRWSYKRISETVFIDLLNEKNTFRDRLTLNGLPVPDRQVSDDFAQTTQTIAIGMEWDWPVIRGSGFATEGHHDRAWWFSANEAWGSDRDFSQIYLSSRWNFLFGDRWKLLVRGELGYTDAEVEEVPLELDDRTAILSVTELPARYRFEAGGSQSVRGYDFNQLSSNGIGSNHLITASAEVEYLMREDWSAVAFVDLGNAFNQWSDTRLKRGWGVGLRWYSLIGAVRVDLARAEDLRGQPWQIYISMGTPLL